MPETNSNDLLAAAARLLNRQNERLVGPATQRDIVELDRMVKMLQVRSYLLLLELRLPDLVAGMAQRMADEDCFAEHGDAQRCVEAALEKDQAYRERNRLACVVARQALQAGARAGTFIDSQAAPGFQTVVAFELPQGQCTFHMDERDDERPWDALPKYDRPWDGHTQPAKWARVQAFLAAPVGDAGGPVMCSCGQVALADHALEVGTDAQVQGPVGADGWVMCSDCGELHRRREDCPNHVAF